MKLISPRNQGVVSGQDLIIEVAQCTTRPTLAQVDDKRVDGEFVDLPYKEAFVLQHDLAELGLSPGEHLLSVAAGSQTAEHTFRNDLSGSDIARRAADGFLLDRRRNRHTWNWDTAILNYGLVKLARHSSHHRDVLVRHLSSYYERWSRQKTSITTPDKAAPALAALHMRQLGYGDFPGAIDPAIQYLRAAPRLDIGCPDIEHGEVLNHVAGNARRVYGSSIWADSLMMYAVLAVHFGAWETDEKLYTFGTAQHKAFACKLLDRDTHLFQHAFRFRTNKRAPGNHAYWLRGNGWVAASLIEVLDELPDGNELRPNYLGLLNDLLFAAAEHQMANGLWDTILNKPGYSFVDTSGACLLAYAILKGIRKGIVDPILAPVAHRVYSAVSASLRQSAGNYVVTRIAGSTNALWRPAYRQMVRVQENRNFGVGAFLMLAVEEELSETEDG